MSPEALRPPNLSCPPRRRLVAGPAARTIAGLLLAFAAPILPAAPPTVVTVDTPAEHEILSAGFQALTTDRCGSPLTTGNRLELLVDGVRSAPVKRRLAAEARATLFVTTMNWSWDEAGRGFAADLVSTRSRGVDVRAIVDGVFADPRIVLALRRGGVRVIRFNAVLSPGWQRRGRMHQKMVVADRARAVIGGMNIGDRFWRADGANGWYHDCDLFVEGPAAGEAARSFLSLWTELEPGDESALRLLDESEPPRATAAPGPRTDHAGEARFFCHDPDRGRDTLADYYVRCIRASRRQVLWYVNNFDPVPRLFDELKAAAERGVRVVLVANSAAGYQERFPGYYRAWFRVLQAWLAGAAPKAGIETWLVDQPIHAKAFSVDGVMASVGSFNFHRTAVSWNLECSLVTHDPATVRQVEEMFERDLARARPVR